ncbi:MAG: hypothetical protein GQE15_12940 [Archangiaceae bacterium]|nr:hypothetical protein [Archangiaceae bacterium]
MKTLSLLCCLFIGCASMGAASREERVISVVRAEALRLLEERLHVHGHVGQVSESARDGDARRFIVTFSDVSDTAAEISVDAQSGAVRSSSLGGGL